MPRTKIALIAACQRCYWRPATAMKIIPVAGAAGLLLAALAGCSSGGPSPAPPPASLAAAPSATGGHTAITTTTTTDPCQLVTAPEASALTGLRTAPVQRCGLCRESCVGAEPRRDGGTAPCSP
jgi:hypothetical protein